ncbi:MAG: flagellar assembly protein FliX [Alphaproteobacteria bacterium]|nr:flagellar assembly protein FliX [Alphaproteobacteria bacterium]
MKVEGPRKSSGTSGSSKSGGAKGTGDGSFSGLIEVGGAAENKPAASGVAINRIDALLSLQEAEEASSEEIAKRAKRRGIDLLDQLDRLRLGLLTGEVPPDALHHLKNMLGAHRDKVEDPQLAAVLDEIDLRVQVELAKFGMNG